MPRYKVVKVSPQYNIFWNIILHMNIFRRIYTLFIYHIKGTHARQPKLVPTKTNLNCTLRLHYRIHNRVIINGKHIQVVFVFLTILKLLLIK